MKKLEKEFREAKSITSTDMIRSFLSKTKCLYKEVEIIVHCICAGAVKISVESVVESLVSRYENHFTPKRQDTKEDNALQEMTISENGPLLQHADNVIEAAMRQYWRKNSDNGQWHFIRRSECIRSYTGGASKVIGRWMKNQNILLWSRNIVCIVFSIYCCV